jgi:lipoprotein-releasing system permease protein
MKFELLVAIRYLKAKRKQAVISLITVISIIGVGVGVAALVIALAMNAGFREDLQKKLLGAQAHVNLLKNGGITDYQTLIARVEKIDGVVAAAPAIHQTVLLHTAVGNKGVFLKGIIPERESKISALADNLVKGSLENFTGQSIILGQELANSLGTFVGDRVQVISTETDVTPLGAIPRRASFEVVGIFSSGLYEYDASWVYIPLEAAQRMIKVGDVVTTVELKVRDIYQASVIGKEIVDTVDPKLEATDWIQMNQPIFQALKLERIVTYITIGLIVMVAALNIVATLIMMVLEKTRDIAILMSMGANPTNIRRIFILQGVIIGVLGTFGGLALGHVISFVADRYRLISLAPDVYTIAYVPFKPNPVDSVIIGLAAILISFLATLYPSAAAARLEPVETLRYE